MIMCIQQIQPINDHTFYPITDNQIGDEGAKHLTLPENLQTLDLCGK